MIELYGSPTPSACMIAIMLEETNLHYSLFPVTKGAMEQHDLEFLKSSPSNQFPVILDRKGPNDQPLVIFEPSAILLYLAQKTGQLLPELDSARYDVLQWLLFENSKIGPTLGNTKHFMYHAPEQIPYAVKRFNNEAKRVFNIIETQLSENEFIAGDFSIADIATYPWMKEHERFGIDEDQIPNIINWLNNLSERKGIQKGMEALLTMKE
jgi:GST-like protein